MADSPSERRDTVHFSVYGREYVVVNVSEFTKVIVNRRSDGVPETDENTECPESQSSQTST